MIAPLEHLIEQTGHALPTLSAARDFTAARLENRRMLASAMPHDEDTAIVLLGSWGRHEVTSGSDDDFLVLVNGPVRPDVRPTVKEVTAQLAGSSAGRRAPGPERNFGTVVFARDLLDRIGLDREKNSDLTRRALLMLESDWVSGEAIHRATRQEIIETYLADTIKDYRPPRFLLNDLIRYWRTIGVDFVAKVRTRKGEGWGLRNAKLRTSRKLLFASGLLPALRCHEYRAEEMAGFLVEQFGLPPLDRLADAFTRYGALDEGASTLVSYDHFLRLIDDPAARSELNAITNGGQAAASPAFDTVARLGTAIDQGLLGLLFSPALSRWTRDFAIL